MIFNSNCYHPLYQLLLLLLLLSEVDKYIIDLRLKSLKPPAIHYNGELHNYNFGECCYYYYYYYCCCCLLISDILIIIFIIIIINYKLSLLLLLLLLRRKHLLLQSHSDVYCWHSNVAIIIIIIIIIIITISIGGESLSVTGTSWFDRQVQQQQ